MPKLEDISISDSGIEGLNAPTLKKVKLFLFFIEELSTQPSFFVLHNQIEELVFGEPVRQDYGYYATNRFDDNLLEVITRNLVNLKRLEILGTNRLTSRASEIIRDNCQSLKVFKLITTHPSIVNADVNLFKIKGLHAYIKRIINCIIGIITGPSDWDDYGPF